MSQPNELRVFISSTFRDLQEEREHLVKKIFPEIRALCRERGITFTEVDLRWGLTEEDAALGRIIRTCLEEIDRCRPYFIGITGDLYGYVPDLVEYYKDEALLASYPWLEEAAMDQSSIVDLEFRYAALNEAEQESAQREEEAAPTHHPSSAKHEEGRLGGVPAPDSSDATTRARFFFRRRRRGSEAPADATETHRLENLRNRIRSAGFDVEEFRDPTSLGEAVYDALMEIIERDFADAAPPTPLDQERARHEAFAASRRQAYIPNAEYLVSMNAWLAEEHAKPLVIYAESGSGKSSLVSFWTEQLRRRQPELPIVEHYVGIGAGDSDHLGIIRHVMEEIQDRFDRSEELPSKPEDLERDFANWLGFTVGSPLVLILDGINQLTGRALDLHWIPPVMPPGVKLIITSTVEQTLVELRGRGWRTLAMQPLNEREREGVIVRYLSAYHKALSKEQIARLVEDAKSSHPLFLRTLLEELRLDSSHETLDARINRYLGTSGTEDLFQQVLERMEDDYSTRAVREVMAVLWASRAGLDERALEALSGVGRLKLSTMISGLDYHLVRKDGRLTFFHDYLRRAVEKRYLADGQKQQTTHEQLAEYYQSEVSAAMAEGSKVSEHMAGELAYQLKAAGASDRLQACLSTMPVFLALYTGQREEEVLGYWSGVVDGDAIDDCYRRGLERWSVADATERSAGLGHVIVVLKWLGRWSYAIELCRERLRLAVGRGNTSEEASSRVSLGSLLQLRGAYDDAVAELTRALDLYTNLGNWRGVANAEGNMGNVYFRRGQYDRALESYKALLRISEELGNRRGAAIAQGNIGSVHVSRGEFDRAQERYEAWLRISEELGDRHSVAGVQGNMGSVYFARGEYDRALESLRVQLRISEELGDREGVANAQGNMGIVYSSRGEYDRALESYGVKLQISEELGDREGVAIAQGNMGNVYFSRGEYDRALEQFHSAAAEHRRIGNRHALDFCLKGAAHILLELVEGGEEMPPYLPEFVAGADTANWRANTLRVAREQAEECVEISEELSTPDMLFAGRVLLGRIDAAEGAADAALHRLGAMVSETTDDAQRAELHYWLWKLGLDPSSDHRAESELLYAMLCERIPKSDYRTRLDELIAAAEPTAPEADDVAA